jgi:hypothetical protein
LTELTRKNKKWEWTEECATSFREFKENLVQAPVLACPNISKPFVLPTDASGFGIASVLTQCDEEGGEDDGGQSIM